MDLILTAHSYVERMVSDDPKNSSGPAPPSIATSSKMKVLLLDKETVGIISMFTTQSMLLKHEIYLIDRLENHVREKMRHLNCLVFVRPSPESIDLLIEELRSPKYASYQLFFTNVVKKSALERLAESDDHEVVTRVQEVFADFFIVNSDLFSINLPPPGSPWGLSPNNWNAPFLTRTSDGLFASLLALKKTSPLIRYDRNSPLAKKLATELVYKIKQEAQLLSQLEKQNKSQSQYQHPYQSSAFGNKRSVAGLGIDGGSDSGFTPDTPPVLLIVDRKNDPLTPLLTPWTYQAMVHEIIGINNNRVDMSKVPDIAKDQKEVVMSPDQDTFFKKTMYLNFGDLGASIKDYVGQYQAKTKVNKNIESIEDMKRFVQDYPEFRRLAGNVSKHVSIVSELSRIVSNENLLEVSQLEQSLACNDSHNSDLKALQGFLQQDSLSFDRKIRLVALYALRYQNHNTGAQQIPMLTDLLAATAPSENDAARVRQIIGPLLHTYAGSQHRQEPLYATEAGFFARAQIQLAKGLKGVDNVYTQHKPLLHNTLSSLIKGKLKRSTHPYMDPGDNKLPAWASSSGGIDGAGTDERPQDIIVFVIGGVTYDEARLVAEINATTPGVRIVLGSTSIINSEMFLDAIQQGGQTWESGGGSNVTGRASAQTRAALRDASPATRLAARIS